MSSTFKKYIETREYNSVNENYENRNLSLFQNMVVYIGGITTTSLIIGFISAIISYYYFCINFLVDYKDNNKECIGQIWNYILTTLICFVVISFSLGGVQTDINKNEDYNTNQKSYAFIIIGMIWVSLGIWGITETNDRECQEIIDTSIWTFANTISIIHVMIGFLTFMINYLN